MSTAIEVDDVGKRFRLLHEKYSSLKERMIHFGKIPYEDLWALKDISFDINEGETFGLLGHNGSGKSTLLKCMAGILQPTTGEIRTIGRLAALLELGAGFHPDLSGRENVYLNASLLGLHRREIERKFDEIVAFAELSHAIDQQVKYYSSGMYVRLGFAVAVNMDPDILLVDEVLAVGDELFQRKCLDRVRQFQRRAGRSSWSPTPPTWSDRSAIGPPSSTKGPWWRSELQAKQFGPTGSICCDASSTWTRLRSSSRLWRWSMTWPTRRTQRKRSR